MRKLTFRFWLINVVIGLTLFIFYRIVISETETKEGTFFEELLFFLDLMLSLGYSLVYLIGILFSSFSIFLNLFEKIRSNFYLSMLSFLGIPIVALGYFSWIRMMISNSSGNYSPDFATTFLLFLVFYLISNFIQYLIFRKMMSAAITNAASCQTRRE